jgi:hypothetical protein
MKEIIILKDLAYIAKSGGGTIADVNEIGLLDNGALAVFDDENVIVPKTTPNLADKRGVYFAQGQDTALGFLGTKVTSVIGRRGNVRVEKKAYSAPVKEIQAIGAETVIGNTPVGAMVIPSTLVEGTVATIGILDITRPFVPVKRSMNINLKVAAGATQTTFMVALVAAINANPNKFVTATIVDTNKGISIEADDYGTKFALTVGGIIEGSTIVNIQKYPAQSAYVKGMYSGYGTYAQILALENAFSGYLGNTNKLRQSNVWYTAGNAAVSSATYTTYSISWSTMSERTFGVRNTNFQEIIIAVPSGAATLITDIETILTEAFGDISDVESGT